MKSLKNMPESLETMTDFVRLRPLFWKYLITAAMFWFVCWYTQARLLIGWKVLHDQLALSLNLGIFRTVQSSSVNTDAKKSVHINGVSVLRGSCY